MVRLRGLPELVSQEELRRLPSLFQVPLKVVNVSLNHIQGLFPGGWRLFLNVEDDAGGVHQAVHLTWEKFMFIGGAYLDEPESLVKSLPMLLENLCPAKTAWHLRAKRDGSLLSQSRHQPPRDTNRLPLDHRFTHPSPWTWSPMTPRPRFHTWLADWPGEPLDHSAPVPPVPGPMADYCALCRSELDRPVQP